VLVLAQEEATAQKVNYIGTEHMLLGIVREGEGVAAQVLVNDIGLELSAVRKEAIQVLAGYSSREVKLEEPAPESITISMSVAAAHALIEWIDAFHTINHLPEKHALMMLRNALDR
jgi:ATP-dependent Clp protease ATP-binding subunit ClpA